MAADGQGAHRRPRTAYRLVDHIVDHLASAGVTHNFGVDGANIEDLYDAAFFHPDITVAAAVRYEHHQPGGRFCVLSGGITTAPTDQVDSPRNAGICRCGCVRWGSTAPRRIPTSSICRPPQCAGARCSTTRESGQTLLRRRRAYHGRRQVIDGRRADRVAEQTLGDHGGHPGADGVDAGVRAHDGAGELVGPEAAGPAIQPGRDHRGAAQR